MSDKKQKITGRCEGWGNYVPCNGGSRSSEFGRDLPATHIYKGKKLCDIHYRIATGNLGRDPEPYIGEIEKSPRDSVNDLKIGVGYKLLKGPDGASQHGE